MGKRKKLGKTTRWAAAEEVISNEDLLTEILLRLPAKSLIRFKSVSKKWLNLISDFNFSSAHTRRNPNSFCSALYAYDRELYSLSHPCSSGHPELSFLDVLGDSHNIDIRASCNGLLLCQSRTNYLYDAPYIVCNPTTQSYRLLPDHECAHGENVLYCTMLLVCLVFDPSKSPHYHVVEAQFNCHQGKRSCEIEIYQSEFASWERGLKFDIPNEWGEINRHESFWNGAIHWISEHGYHIWFDPYLKELNGIKLPVHPRIRFHDIRYFGECDGRLFLIQFPQYTPPARFVVLVMGVDYCSWVKKYTVNLKGLLSDDPHLDDTFENCGFYVMSIAKGGKSEDLSLVLSIGGYVVSYGLQSKTWLQFEENDYYDHYHISYPFIESLTPV